MLKQVEETVEDILRVIESTRNDDMWLYALYVQRVTGTTRNLHEVFVNPVYRKEHKVSSFGSVSRTRRKLQQKHEELRANKTIERYRGEREVEFKTYANS